jgi:hypothetical protein
VTNRVLLTAIFFWGAGAEAQTAYSYNTSYFSVNGHTLYATTVTSGQMGSGSPYQHAYYAYSGIQGPKGSPSQTGGGTVTTGYVPASGTYSVTSSASMTTTVPGPSTVSNRGYAYCTFVGPGAPFYDSGNDQEVLVDNPVISSVIDNSTGDNTFSVYSSGTLEVLGAWLTAGGMSTPTISADNPGISLSIVPGQAFPTEDQQVTVSYTISQDVPSGTHTLAITTVDNGQSLTSNAGAFFVGDPTPKVTAVSPSLWKAGTSVSVTITGTGFGTNPSLAISGTGITSSSVTSASDLQIVATVVIDSSAPAGTATLSVTSHGFDGNSFAPQHTGGSPSGNGSAQVAAMPPPTLQVKLNGAVVAANSTVYIDPTPSLPLIGTLVPSRPGVQLSGQVSWTSQILYIVPGRQIYSCQDLGTLAASASWTVINWCGGQATLSAVYNGVTYSLSFNVLGTNPQVSAIQSQIGPSPWYARQLARSENGGQLVQFLANGQPTFGAPNGYGIMQIDNQTLPSDLWNWKINIEHGMLVINATTPTASKHWVTFSVPAWQKYNQQNPLNPVAMHVNVTEGSNPCVFSNTPAAGQHPFIDGIAIKMYNAGNAYSNDFMYWDPNTNSWKLQDIYGGFNYVSRVCSNQP